MSDPCGGNTRGGSGCTCDPPFGLVADYGLCEVCRAPMVVSRITNGDEVEMRLICPMSDVP